MPLVSIPSGINPSLMPVLPFPCIRCRTISPAPPGSKLRSVGLNPSVRSRRTALIALPSAGEGGTTQPANVSRVPRSASSQNATRDPSSKTSMPSAPPLYVQWSDRSLDIVSSWESVEALESINPGV